MRTACTRTLLLTVISDFSSFPFLAACCKSFLVLGSSESWARVTEQKQINSKSEITVSFIMRPRLWLKISWVLDHSVILDQNVSPPIEPCFGPPFLGDNPVHLRHSHF